MSDFYIVECPHCKGVIQIFKTDINCGIFRHGELNPHASKQECEQYIKDHPDKGCGKPFQFQEKTGVEICEYV